MAACIQSRAILRSRSRNSGFSASPANRTQSLAKSSNSLAAGDIDRLRPNANVRLENATLCVKFHQPCKRNRAQWLSQGGNASKRGRWIVVNGRIVAIAVGAGGCRARRFRLVNPLGAGRNLAPCQDAAVVRKDLDCFGVRRTGAQHQLGACLAQTKDREQIPVPRCYDRQRALASARRGNRTGLFPACTMRPRA
jgi:hypothetical protein